MSTEENATMDKSVSKPLIAETKLCSICLLSGSTDDNDPIVYCDRCGVIVHESCYNADTLDDKSSESSSPSEYWFCTPCLARVDDPTCALCPTKDSCLAFWPTLESSWVHVVCALGVPGVLFYDELYYTPVDLSNIPSQKFGNKSCHICESRSGVSVGCDAGLCPNSFHLSCAHKNGFLQIRGELSKIECELYCATHQSSSNTYKAVQRNYTICEVQQKQLDNKDKLNKEITQTLVDHWPIYRKRSESFPRLPKPTKSHLARSFIADPVALKEFFEKAQHLHPNQTTTLLHNFDLTSTNTNALLAFTTNEEELGQIRERIADAENKLAQLESTSNDKTLKDEHKKLETELKKEYETLTILTEQYKEFIEIFQLYSCSLREDTMHHLSNVKLPHLSSSFAKIPENNCCLVCEQTDRSNQMIKCCQCHLTFHGDCLQPPMPTKTLSLILSGNKKYDWQCASCVNAQQEELDQCKVNIDEPRRIRPRRTNELVLRESVIKFGSRKRKQDSEPSSTVNSNQNKKQSKNSKKTKTSDEFSAKSKRTSLSVDSSSSSKEDVNSNRNGEKLTSKSRTSVIKQLFNRKPTDFTAESSPKWSSSSKRTSLKIQKSPRISIKGTSKSKLNDSPETPVRSKSLTVEHRTPTIFKQKAFSVPVTKPEKKKRKVTKDPMSIFDFYDDDENANGTIELHSSIKINQNDKKLKKKQNNDDNQPKQNNKSNRINRRSKVIISNDVPTNALCTECSKSGTDQTMTDCDKCKKYYHYACCVPPLLSFPKRRNYGWTCHRCNDDNENDT